MPYALWIIIVTTTMQCLRLPLLPMTECTLIPFITLIERKACKSETQRKDLYAFHVSLSSHDNKVKIIKD